MTSELQKLAEDNINLCYKYFGMHHIYDEDTQQDLLLRYCRSLEQYKPEYGTIGTFVFTVLTNEMHKIHKYKTTKGRTGIVVSLEDALYKNSDPGKDGESLTYEDILGEEDEALNNIEYKSTLTYLFNMYRKYYPETCEKDLDVFVKYTLGLPKEEWKTQYNFSHQRAEQISRKVRAFFRCCDDNKLKTVAKYSNALRRADLYRHNQEIKKKRLEEEKKRKAEEKAEELRIKKLEELYNARKLSCQIQTTDI